MMLIFLLSIVTLCEAGRGLDKAQRVIEAPVTTFSRTTDRLLMNNIDLWDEKAFKLQVLRTRIGHAWEWVFTDYGFTKSPSGIDLINRRRRIAIELKNGYKINSVIKRNNIALLKQFKRNHPGYTVILGCINYKDRAGKQGMRDGVKLLYGNYLLRYIFRGQETQVINVLRQSVRRYVQQN